MIISITGALITNTVTTHAISIHGCISISFNNTHYLNSNRQVVASGREVPVNGREVPVNGREVPPTSGRGVMLATGSEC